MCSRRLIRRAQATARCQSRLRRAGLRNAPPRLNLRPSGRFLARKRSPESPSERRRLSFLRKTGGCCRPDWKQKILAAAGRRLVAAPPGYHGVPERGPVVSAPPGSRRAAECGPREHFAGRGVQGTGRQAHSGTNPAGLVDQYRHLKAVSRPAPVTRKLGTLHNSQRAAFARLSSDWPPFQGFRHKSAPVCCRPPARLEHLLRGVSTGGGRG